MRNVRNKWLRAAVVASFFLVIVGFIFLPEVGRFAKKAAMRDRMEAAVQDGVATVVILVPEVPDGGSAPSPAQVSVRFRGAIRPVKEVIDIGGLTVNKPARIQFRVGRSGRIYIESARPIDEPIPLGTTSQNSVPAVR